MPAGLLRCALAVTTAAALSASMALAGAAPAGAAPVGPCTNVQFIGLRGSGEPLDGATHNMGTLLSPVAEKAASLAPSGTTISFYGVPYQAIAVDNTNLVNVVNGKYQASELQGESLLHTYLADVTAACPDMKLVVLGYSQGAQAVGNDLPGEPASVAVHVADITLFGDPLFNPAAPYVYGSYDPTQHGGLGKRSVVPLSGFGTKVGSWCRRNDIVCQGLGKGHSVGQHLQAGYLSDYNDTGWAPSFIRNNLGWPFAKPNSPLDLAFAIDSTGSMASAINGAETAARSMATTLAAKGSDFRVGLVDYKDTDQGDPYAARVDTPFTTSTSDFGAALSSLVANGGGDTPEAVYSGVMTAINGLTWRHGARKAIIVIGDAPGKDPEPVTGYTKASVLAAANALDPAIIYTVPISGGPGDFFTQLATGSDGLEFPADDPSLVTDELLAAVDAAAVPLTAALSVSTPAAVGAPVSFSAAGSWYDGGTITGYAWDFNGDGTTDATTTSPQTTHTFTAATTTKATVTVTTNDAHTASASADVTVTGTAPAPASAPTNLALTGGADGTSLSATWSPPADLGGSIVAGYLLEASDTATGTVVALAGITDPATTTAQLTDLPAGAYSVAVWAVTDAGEGARATSTITLGANHAPAATNITATTTAGTPTPVTLAATDTESDPLTYTVLTQPTHGTLSGTAPKLTYTPPAGFTGTDSFTYKVNDGHQDSNTATATITVTPVAAKVRLDRAVSADARDGQGALIAGPLSTRGGGELLLAFVSADGGPHSGRPVTSVSGGGLTWTLASHANPKYGATEVWQAYSAEKQKNLRVKAQWSDPGHDHWRSDHGSAASVTVAAFTGAGQRVGATSADSAGSGRPQLVVDPTATGSLVWAAGRDWSRATDIRLGYGQELEHLFIDRRDRETAWVQSLTARTVASHPVRVQAAGLVWDRWSMVAVEIVPATG